MDEGINQIVLEIQGWLDWQLKERDKEGLPSPDSTNIMQVPHWPSRGQLKNWIIYLERVSKK